jgi:type I restriction enzyme, S subunit
MGVLCLVSIANGQVDPLRPRYRDFPLIAPDHIEPGTGRLLKRDSARNQGAISGKYLVKPGSIVYSKIRPYLQKAFLCEFDALCSADMYPLVPKHGVVSTFILHTLLSEDFTAFATSVSARSGIPKINRTELSEYVVWTPPSTEQAGIAEALDSADLLIAGLERLIAKKKAIKQGMMQQLLTGETRLPGFTRKWKPQRLADLLSYEQPGPFLVRTNTQLENGSIPVLTAGKTFLLGYTNDTDGIYRAYPVIIFDDFTTACQYVDFDFKAKSSAMKILSARAGTNLRFIYERMQLIKFPLGDHKRYWISEYSQQIVDVPEPKEQEVIAEILEDCTDEIRSLRLRLAKAKSIKQGMMQELLTGRTRLPVAEEATT